MIENKMKAKSQGTASTATQSLKISAPTRLWTVNISGFNNELFVKSAHKASSNVIFPKRNNENLG